MSRRPPPEFRIPRSEAPAALLLALLVIGAPQLYGGVFPWSVVAIAVTAFAALLAMVWATRGEQSALGTPWLALAICGAAGWTLLQALPLPCALVSALASDGVSELRAALAIAGAPAPEWCTLSRDPGATRLEALKGVAIAGSFLTAWRLSAHGARELVIWSCAISTLVMSCVAHLHMALGLKEVFGLYKPLYAPEGLQLAPLMNPNNLGGFAAFGVPIWIGILRRDRNPRSRAIAAIAIVLTATTALLSLSRGAIAMLFGCIALMAFFSLVRARRSRRAGGRRRWLTRLSLGLALSLAIAIGVYLTADRVLLEFERGGVDKLTLIGEALRFAAKHPWLGVGRGAFASSFAGGGNSVYYAYAENFLAQWAADWGYPVTLLLLATIAHALWRALFEAESPRRLGAIVAVIGLAAQNLFDLGLELAGVVVVAAALLAAVVAPSRRSQLRATAVQRLAPQRFSAAVAAVAAGVLLWLAPVAERDSVIELETAMRAEVDAKDRGVFRGLLERAVRLHPVEPRFVVLAASEALLHRDPKALRWINRGMRLAPGWTAPHIQAFQWLWLHGRRDQALIELRAAAEIQPGGLISYVCHVTRTGADLALRAAPRARGPRRAAFLEMAATCVGTEHPTSSQLDAVLLREFPSSPAARERRAVRLVHQGKLDAALAELDALQRQDPTRERARTLRVELLFGAKRYAEAARTALDATQSATTLPAAARLWTLRARALAELGDDAGWAAAVAALRRTVSDDIDQLAETYALEGELHHRRHQSGAALRSYRDAYGIKEDSKYLAAYAGISMQLGDRASALWAYMRLCELEPGHDSYCATRDSIKAEGRALNFGAKVRN